MMMICAVLTPNANTTFIKRPFKNTRNRRFISGSHNNFKLKSVDTLLKCNTKLITTMCFNISYHILLKLRE